MGELEFTGERLLPSVFGKVSIEHLHRYALALAFTEGKVVLDIACGEGYGSNLIAKSADQVVGVDISRDAVDHAKEKYTKSNLKFIEGSVFEIPVESNLFDVVISFETIEHVSDHLKMMREIKRVLKPDGILVISTPERMEYSNKNRFNNQFHEKELSESEFINLIISQFSFFQLGYQKFLSGSFIQLKKGTGQNFKMFKGDFKSVETEKEIDKEYLIAISSDSPFAIQSGTSFFKIGSWEKYLFQEHVEYEVEKIRKSFRYRLGTFLIYPFLQLKKLFK